MCCWRRLATSTGDAPINASQAEQQARDLAAQGYRVIALADGEMEGPPPAQFDEAGLRKMTLLGLVCLIDPLRAEAKDAVPHSGRTSHVTQKESPLMRFVGAGERGLLVQIIAYKRGELTFFEKKIILLKKPCFRGHPLSLFLPLRKFGFRWGVCYTPHRY